MACVQFHDCRVLQILAHDLCDVSGVPQLKRLALNGRFIGPVNYHYDGNYLTTFLQRASPPPDEVSWHEYSCDDS